MKMLDLFSGLGGASQAFLDNGWEVYRYDSNPVFSSAGSKHYVEETQLWNALDTSSKFPADIDFFWASPPCIEFSRAYSSPRSKAEREGKPWNPSLELLEATLRWRDKVNPRYWAIENVLGAVEYFKPYLGDYRVKIGSACIWGNFPIIGFTNEDSGWKQKLGDKHRWSDIRSNQRAKIPLWLSEQMRKSVQYQSMIDDFSASLADVSWAWLPNRGG